MQLYHSRSTKPSRSNINRGKAKMNEKSRGYSIKELNIKNNKEKILEEIPKLKVYYKYNNYFHKDNESEEIFLPKKRKYFNRNENLNNYNIASNNSNESHRRIWKENEYTKNKSNPEQMSSRNNYNEFKYRSFKLKKPNINQDYNENKNLEYFIDSNGYSDNNYNNYQEYYESQNDYENQDKYKDNIMNQRSQNYNYNQFKREIDFFSSPISEKNTKGKNIHNNYINRQNNFYNDKKMKVRTINKNIQNFGNRTTTTNNTYNNNIYCINSIEVKNKNRIMDRHSDLNSNRNYNINYRKRMKRKEREYFKINNIDKSEKDAAATLIQSFFRGYLIKVKVFNFIKQCISCEKLVEIIQDILLERKKYSFNLLMANINTKSFLNNSTTPSSNFSIQIKKINKNNIKGIMINSDSKYDTYKDQKEKEINELKSKLNDIMKENNELKVKLFDLKNNEKRLKSLLEENKKYKYINDIILKDNKQLSEKLDDIHRIRNYSLVIQNQIYFNFNHSEKNKNQDMNKKNEVYVSKLKKFMAEKLIYKKINNNNNIIDDKSGKNKNNYKFRENNFKKEIYLKSLINIIEKYQKSKIIYYFWKLYKYSQMEKEKEIKKLLLNNKLKKIIYRKEQENKKILRKIFFKFIINSIKYDNYQLKKAIIDDKKITKLKKICNKYEKDVFLIYKVILEKWNLKSKIIGMKTAARDKKKKRKQKKKIFKLLNHKYSELYEKNKSSSNLNPKFNEGVNIFRSMVSIGGEDKDYEENNIAKLLMNNSVNNISNENNELSNDENIIDNKLRTLNKNVLKNKYFKEKTCNSYKVKRSSDGL